jgi:UDP-glucose 4-epimerase
MKIFITGIAGFLGSHLADRMISLGHEVMGVDSLIGGEQANVPENAEFAIADCANLTAMTKHMAGSDIVIHAACTAYEGLSVFSPSLVTQNTFQITSTLLSAAIQNNVKRFVFCSSMARYGAQETIPFTEDMICNPEDPYGIAKYASEQLIQNLCKVHNMEYVIAVPHNIIGNRQKYDDPFRNVASIMINMMLQGKQPIIYGDGNQMRCFSFVDDCISCLEKTAFLEGISGEVFNIGPDEEFVTINQLAEIIADIIGFKLEAKYMPSRPQEVKLASCSANKARKMLGYKTTVPLREGLTELVNCIKKAGPKRFRYHLDVEIISPLTPATWTNKLF